MSWSAQNCGNFPYTISPKTLTRLIPERNHIILPGYDSPEHFQPPHQLYEGGGVPREKELSGWKQFAEGSTSILAIVSVLSLLVLSLVVLVLVVVSVNKVDANDEGSTENSLESFIQSDFHQKKI